MFLSLKLLYADLNSSHWRVLLKESYLLFVRLSHIHFNAHLTKYTTIVCIVCFAASGLPAGTGTQHSVADVDEEILGLTRPRVLLLGSERGKHHVSHSL